MRKFFALNSIQRENNVTSPRKTYFPILATLYEKQYTGPKILLMMESEQEVANVLDGNMALLYGHACNWKIVLD